MTIVGLTGGIGSGKSEVAAMLAERGAVVMSGDDVARDLVRPGSPQLQRIVEHFGGEVLLEDGTLDRKALADIVFSDERELDVLNDIMDGPIQAELERRSRGCEGVVVIESPLLIERGRTQSVDFVVVVMAPLDERLERLTTKRNISHADALNRISRQTSDDERTRVADFVIVNDAGLDELREQVAALWERIS